MGRMPLRRSAAATTWKSGQKPRNPSDSDSRRAFFATSHSMPPITRATTLPPSITMPLASLARGATPNMRPPTARPTMEPAVCVPWSPLSTGVALGTSSPRASNSA